MTRTFRTSNGLGKWVAFPSNWDAFRPCQLAGAIREFGGQAL